MNAQPTQAGHPVLSEADLLADDVAGSRDWTLRLIADLDGPEWFHQPAPGLAHPLWLCGHLAVSQNTLIHERCLGRGILPESFRKHFPIGAPVKSVSEYSFPSVAVVLDVMADVHAQTLLAVRAMSPDLLREPAFAADGKSPHPHYRDKRGVVVHCVRHEAFHAGQLAMIRRLLGKAFLR